MNVTNRRKEERRIDCKKCLGPNHTTIFERYINLEIPKIGDKCLNFKVPNTSERCPMREISGPRPWKMSKSPANGTSGRKFLVDAQISKPNRKPSDPSG